jgi:hypothetical protein
MRVSMPTTLPATRRQLLRNPRVRFPAYRRDDETAAASRALRSFAPSLKRLEEFGGVRKSEASRWWREGGSPLHHVESMIRLAVQRGTGHAGALVASVRIALRHALMESDAAELVTRFYALQQAETEAQGRADVEQITFAQTGDMAGLETALQAHADVLEDLVPVIRELRLRRIDPRQEGRA